LTKEAKNKSNILIINNCEWQDFLLWVPQTSIKDLFVIQDYLKRSSVFESTFKQNRKSSIIHAPMGAVFFHSAFPRKSKRSIESLFLLPCQGNTLVAIIASSSSTKAVCARKVLACLLIPRRGSRQKYIWSLSSGIKSRLSADFYYALAAAQNNFQTALAFTK